MKKKLVQLLENSYFSAKNKFHKRGAFTITVLNWQWQCGFNTHKKLKETF